jgi:hypothetical protein
MMSERDTPAADLLRLADQLKQILDRQEAAAGNRGQNPTEKGASTLRYTLRMEEALMRVQANTREALSAAIEIYRELEVLFPDRPMVRYRLGWALGKEGKPLEALDRYFEALRLVDEASTLEPEERAKRVSEEEAHLIRERLPRLIGYQYWRIAEDRETARDPQMQLAYLVEAYRATEAGLNSTSEGSTERKKLHNNMMYYVIQYLKICAEPSNKLGGASLGLLTRDDLNKHLLYIEKHVDLDSHRDVDDLDTLCRAYVLLEQHMDAVRVAERILTILFEEPGHPERLDEAQMEIAAHTNRVILMHRRRQRHQDISVQVS